MNDAAAKKEIMKVLKEERAKGTAQIDEMFLGHKTGLSLEQICRVMDKLVKDGTIGPRVGDVGMAS